MKNNLKLYGCLLCPYVQRVRFFLEQAQIPYDYQEINLLTKENQQEWYKTINPSGKVPSLICNENKIIVESLVINEFLCEAYYPQALPTDYYERANIRRWICYLFDNIISLFNTLFTKLKEGNKEELDKTFMKLQENWAFYVSNSLLDTGKNFLFSENISLADFATLPFLQNEDIVLRTLFSVNLFESNDPKISQSLKLLKKYYEYCKENTAFEFSNKKARIWPSAEKDSIIKDFGMTSIDKYDYERYITEVYSRFYLSDMKKK